MRYRTHKKQKGAVLLVSVLLLLVLTIIGIEGMSTSVMGLRMAGNVQGLYDSFQLAEAGRAKAIADTDFDADGDQSYEYTFGDSDSKVMVNVARLLPDVERNCPRKSAASSASLVSCEYYTVESEHDAPVSGARTKVFEGVTREILAK